MEDPELALSPRQQAMYEMYEAIAEQHGQFDHTSGPDGAHYISAEDNAFAEEGLICANCSFYEGGQRCEIVEGRIDPLAVCKLWVISEDLLTSEVEVHKASYTPPEAVRREAARALKWISEGHAGDGFTAVGRKRAADLARGATIGMDTIRRMRSFLARHEVDKQGQGWSPDQKGYPSAGRVAWAAWGGDPAKSWVNSIVSDMEKRRGFGGDRAAAAAYAANVRWQRSQNSRMGEEARTRVGEKLGQLAAGTPISVTRREMPEVTERLLNGEGKENIRMMRVEGTPYFDSEGVNLSRADMPQVPSGRKEEFVADVAAKGLRVSHERVNPLALKPIQNEINGKSSAEIMRREAARGPDAFRAEAKGSIIVSSDGFVMDGHHRWAAAALHQLSGNDARISIIRIGAPQDALLGMMKAWSAEKGIPRLGFSEHPSRPVGKAVTFDEMCALALKEESNHE